MSIKSHLYHTLLIIVFQCSSESNFEHVLSFETQLILNQGLLSENIILFLYIINLQPIYLGTCQTI